MNSIRVEIFGKTYTVQGDLEEAYVQELAQKVDEKMRAIAGVTRSFDTGAIAVLAALHLADEAETRRRRQVELRRRVKRCLRLVDTALERPA